MSRSQAAPAIALIIVAVAAGWWWAQRAPEPAPTFSSYQPQSTTVSSNSTITVHVAGLVQRPGLVELPEGSRVADAVAAAGGLLPGAMAEAVNLAAPVGDGEQVVIPGADQASRNGSQTPVTDGKVHLNRATAVDLEALPGVGPVLAERIVAYRDENGPFETLEDLLDVPGIGEAKLSSFRDLLAIP